MEQRFRAGTGWKVLFGALLAVLLPGSSGCSRSALPEPEEILHEICLDFPSILGYVRVRSWEPSEAVRTVPDAMPFDAPIPVPGSFLGVTASVLFRLLDQVQPVCREGSHINIVFLDPGVFGGPVALHLVPGEGASLVDVLDAGGEFERVPGSDPPEFIQVSRPRMMEQVLGLLQGLGFDTPRVPAGGASRILVEETPRGILVMPSYDVRRDLLLFLEATDYLEPWGETSLVVNIEVHRLLGAYAEEARRWGRSFRTFLAKTEAMVAGKDEWMAGLLRAARVIPSLLLETVKAVEGIRYVSASPRSGRPELTFVAAGEGFLARILRCLRGGSPELLGVVPWGLAMQWNADPSILARVVMDAPAFYAEEVDIEDGLKERVARELLMTMADDQGPYLFGLSADLEGFFGLWACAVEGVKGADPSGGSIVAPLFRLAFPDKEARWRGDGQGLWRFEVDGEGPDHLDLPFAGEPGFRGMGGAVPIPVPLIEAGFTEGLQVTTVQLVKGGEGKASTRRLLRAARAGAPASGDPPEGSCLYFKLSLPPFPGFTIPGIEKMPASGIMGHGIVEENRLVIELLH